MRGRNRPGEGRLRDWESAGDEVTVDFGCSWRRQTKAAIPDPRSRQNRQVVIHD